MYCIDYRYDSLSSNYLNEIGYSELYYLSTGTGASLALGYEKYCKCNCNTKCKKSCDTYNEDMDIIKKIL